MLWGSLWRYGLGMETRKITSVVVIDAQRIVEGVIHLHDLWRTQMF